MRAGRSRAGHAVLAVILVIVAGLVSAPGSTAAPLATISSAAAKAGSVRVSVVSISPSVPTLSAGHKPLTIELELTNTTSSALGRIRIRAERGDPIEDQISLEAAVAKPRPSQSPVDIPPVGNTAPTATLGPKGSVTDTATLAFVTTTGIVDDSGICLCGNWIDPLLFTAEIQAADGTVSKVGSTTTFLPIFFNTKPKPVPVSWVWPLIDRPHRLGDTAFTDDDLAGEVNGGRLDRALRVVEEVAPSTPITLMIDPELLDELEVMATVKYTVQLGASPARLGTGASAAQDWLGRLSTLLSTEPTKPNVSVELTPYADPDIQSLTTHGLSWTSVLPQQMADRVTQALAGKTLDTDLAWPASGAVSSAALDALSRAGTTTVILNSSAVKPVVAGAGLPQSLATLSTKTGPVTAALTNVGIQRAAALAIGTNGPAALPELLSRIAVRADQSPTAAPPVVITPPRYVDPAPDAAAAAIMATSNTARVALAPKFAAATALGNLVRVAGPVARSSLTSVPTLAGLPAAIIDGVRKVTRAQPVLKTLLVASPAASVFESSLAVDRQRVESSAWRTGSPLAQMSTTGLALTGRLASLLDTIKDAVRIVKPSSGSYTLASSNAPLPITVENTSVYTFRVEVGVTAVNGLPGFRPTGLGPLQIAPGDKETLHIPTHVDRSGRIKVEAQLRAPSIDGRRGPRLGDAVQLTVRSTVLGTIGVVITIVAGAVLVLALVVRFVRRLRHRGARRPEPEPEPQPEPSLAP